MGDSVTGARVAGVVGLPGADVDREPPEMGVRPSASTKNARMHGLDILLVEAVKTSQNCSPDAS